MELSKHSPHTWTESFKRFVSTMDQCAVSSLLMQNDTLLRALRYASPYIVTNSNIGWVDYSCKKYMPDTWKTLQREKIRVISARDMYQKKHPNKDMEWKRLAFIEITRKIPRDSILNLIVVGDSSAEHEAALYVSQ